MNFLRLSIACFILLGASCADAGVIVSQDEVALNKMTVSAYDCDSSESQDEERPFVRDGKSQGMSASFVSSVKTSNSNALEDSAQLFLPTFKPRHLFEFENAELPPSPILDGLLKPS